MSVPTAIANDMLAKNPKVFQVQELPKTAFMWSLPQFLLGHSSIQTHGTLSWL
jgi:hypothetical protein